MDNKIRYATFGAGCFWCVEAVFQRLKGVTEVTSGYTGGAVQNPSYREVCSGLTGHAEVVRIAYEPEIIKYDELLQILWTTHDPTTLNRQGADKGTQYRSAIYYHSEQQKKSAELSKANIATQIWDDPIVTEITEAPKFYPAELDHQDYYNQNSIQPYCRIVINPKIAKLKSKYTSLLKPEYV